MVDPHSEDIFSAVGVLGQHVGVTRKGTGFIATVLKVFVVLWVLGLIVLIAYAA